MQKGEHLVEEVYRRVLIRPSALTASSTVNMFR
ncbi:hypothetical protein FHY33_001958 [Xanthomonas arboricola]|nr:hypothetical protein [Xanthomonas campestris]